MDYKPGRSFGEFAITMPATTVDAANLLCERCGYDLRAHADEGKCSECGWAVSDSKRYAAIPRRPAWKESDPRWRRRVLAGLACMVLVLVMHVATAFEWTTHLPALSVFHYHGTVVTLGDSLIAEPILFIPVGFCCGMVLLFSKESNRRRSRLDWTRRWGVLCCYVVFFLAAARFVYSCSAVTIGLASLFNSLPTAYQPTFTPWFSKIGYAFLRYGPHFSNGAFATLVAFSAIAVLLACVQLCEALWSVISRWLAGLIVLPLVGAALILLLEVGRYVGGKVPLITEDVREYIYFFRPGLLTVRFFNFPAFFMPSDNSVFWISAEATKWGIIVGIALVLSIAQLLAWKRKKKTAG